MARKSKICQMCMENTPELAKNYCDRCEHSIYLDSRIEKEKRYRAKNPDKVAAVLKKWYKNNHDKAASRNKEWAKNNRNKMNTYGKEWREKNKDKEAERQREWHKNNHDRVVERQRAYRARKKQEAENAKIQADNKISQA